MSRFTTKVVPAKPDVTAPDGSDVRVLVRLKRGSTIHFRLAPGQTSVAVAHRTVDEIWYVLSGRGEIWRRQDERAETTPLEPGVSLTIPRGTHFQFRALGEESLDILGVTMPAWPGDDEAVVVEGAWQPDQGSGSREPAAIEG